MPSQIDVFHSALERPPEDREAFLRDAYGEEPELVQRVIQLLKAHEAAEGGGLEARADSHRQVIRSITRTPKQIGPYEVLERIGEGGMGTVYAAEQTHPLRRKVAIKVVKLGMDTEEVLSRFEAERQAMAIMDHPGVAMVLDAGATEEGRPYFVMELVTGATLTSFCESEQPSLREKLQLFVRICEAVHHAHQRGIIHRDLKPSNILVAKKNGEAQPKIIDFGIAKATATQLTEDTFVTADGRLIGTLEYMSPEQAGLSSMDVDTRSDVFALGVILYELITGVLPIDRDVLRTEGLPEFMDRLREVRPPRPSTRLAQMADASQVSQASARPPARSIRGELDWVVMRAIEKERSQRYSSAASLQDDVERYLSDRPVEARPPKASYIAAKFIKRHRIVAALVGLALLSVLGGVVGLTIGLLRANRAEALATHRADNAQAAAAFLERVLFQSDPEFGDDSLTVLQVLTNADSWIGEELSGFPEVEASVRESIGVAFRRKSLYPQARPHLLRSLELRRAVLGNSSLETAGAAVAVADLRFEHEGTIEPSLALLTEARGALTQHGLGDSVASAWLDLDMGLIALAGDRVTEAEAALRRCADVLAADRGESHPDLSRPLRGLAWAAACRGDLDRAEDLALRAVACCSDEASRYLGARARQVLAKILLEKAEIERASAELDQTGDTLAATSGKRHIRMAERDALLARLHLREEQFVTAKVAADLCTSLRSELLEEDHWSLMEARLLKLRALIGLGELEQATELLEEIDGHASRHLVRDHRLMIELAQARLALARARGNEGESKASEQRLAELLQSRAARL